MLIASNLFTNVLSFCPSPHYQAEPSEFDIKKGFSITFGKCWTLKMDKQDETTPGPVYDTQYL